MKNTNIKIAVIGAGCWGRNLVRVFAKLGVLDTVCDLDPKILKQLKKKFPKVRIIAAYSKILKDELISAVVIATPAMSHYKLAKEFLLAGKDVFVEKPLAMNLAEGKELVSLASQKNKILMVGHILEYHPALIKLKEYMDDGRLGKIRYLYSSRLNLGRLRKEENILWSFAPHDISAMLMLLGEMPKSVCVNGANYLKHSSADVTLSNFNFSNGVKAAIFVSWLHPFKEQRFVVIGSRKMAVFDDVAVKDKLLVLDYKVGRINKAPVIRKNNIEKLKFDRQEPLALECRHFLECLKKRKAAKTDAISALKVLAVLEACQESLEHNAAMIYLNRDNLEPNRAVKYQIHPTATVEYPCNIGNGTKIWHYSHVMKGARIGENCNIGRNVFIGPEAELGNNVKVQNNVSIFDGVNLGDDVFCGPSVVFTNVSNPRSHISRRHEFKPTFVKKGATLGANSTIICGNSIGEYAFVGGGAVVTQDVPAYALVYGNPARLKGWVCKCASKLDFNKPYVECPACGEKFNKTNGSVKCINIGDRE